MGTKHTQGEWFINPRSSRNVRYGSKTIANCSQGQNGENEEEEIANAKLIAAAPDLLKACISALKDVQEINKMLIAHGHHGYVLMETELDEVIKKAKVE